MTVHYLAKLLSYLFSLLIYNVLFISTSENRGTPKLVHIYIPASDVLELFCTQASL